MLAVLQEQVMNTNQFVKIMYNEMNQGRIYQVDGATNSHLAWIRIRRYANYITRDNPDLMQIRDEEKLRITIVNNAEKRIHGVIATEATEKPNKGKVLISSLKEGQKFKFKDEVSEPQRFVIKTDTKSEKSGERVYFITLPDWKIQSVSGDVKVYV